MCRLISPYRFPGQYWYKGQTHCHSNNSDGSDNQSPREVVEAYKNKGYQFVCLTDHSFCLTSKYPAPDPGLEDVVYIPSLEDGFAGPNHLLGLDLDFEAVEQYYGIDSQRDSNKNGADNSPSGQSILIQQRLDYFTEVQKAIAIVAHPDNRLGCEFKDLQNNSRYTGLEIYSGDDVWSLDWWFRVIQSGIYRKVWGTASDDCHSVDGNNFASFNRGWIVINSPKNPADYLGAGTTPDKKKELKDHLVQNIKTGNFYAVIRSPHQDPSSGGPNDAGPHMQIWTVGTGGVWGLSDTPTVNVITDQQSRIDFLGGAFGNTETKTLHSEEGLSASYTPEEWVDWIVISLSQQRPDGQEYWAYSQPIFQEKYFSLESASRQGCFLRHRNFLGELTEENFHLRSLPAVARGIQINTLRFLEKFDYSDGTFRIVPGGLVGGSPSEGLVSFEALNWPGWYLRHQNFRLCLSQRTNDSLFLEDATFILRPGLRYGNPNDPNWVSLESVNYPGYFIRESDSHLYLHRRADEPIVSDFEAQATFRLCRPLCAGIAFDAFC